MNWIKELDFTPHFTEEYNEIVELIGLDNFLKLFHRFKKMPVYFTETPIVKLKKEYIKKCAAKINSGDVSINKLAFKLDVSERFIYGVLADKNSDNYHLFDEDSNG